MLIWILDGVNPTNNIVLVIIVECGSIMLEQDL